MFDSFPAVFRNQAMANKAAKAYEGEEGKEWTVIYKKDDAMVKWYKACRVKDYDNDVKRHGWCIAD